MATFYQWRAKLGGIEVDETQGLHELASENSRLKQRLAEAHLGHQGAQGQFWGKTIAPQCRRKAVRRMLVQILITEWRSCHLSELTRDSFCHPPTPGMAKRIELAQQQRAGLITQELQA